MEAGRRFDDARLNAYPYNELYIAKPGSTRYYRLDSYNPRMGEIVSRKCSQLSDVTEKTAKGYVDEIVRKYPVGAQIANVPSSGDLPGHQLQGRYYLEVPVQNAPIPRSILDYAEDRDVFIRDITGKTY